MNFLKIAWRDISSIFRNRFIRVSVTAIIIVPLLYSLLYLAAFWDPYSRLENVKVAVVNLDTGTTVDGKETNYGQQVVDNLKSNHELGWTIVSSKEEADKGLKGKDYYAEYIIPTDFSEKVVSAKGGKPEQPQITYRSNDKKNFLAAQINGKAEVLLKAQIAQKITKEYTKVAFDNLYELKDGLNQAADGSKKISDGLSTAKDGVGQAKDKVTDAITQLNGNQDIKYLLQPSTAPAARQLLNDGLAAKDMDTSMLSLVNNTNVNMITSTVNTANGVVNSNGVKVIMQTPSVQNLLNQFVSGNQTALQARLQAGNKLMGDANLLISAASQVDAGKLNTMLSPFSQVLSSDQAMQYTLTNANSLINDAVSLNNALNSIKSDPSLTPVLTNMAKQNPTTALAGVNALIKDADTLNAALTAIKNDTNAMQALNTLSTQDTVTTLTNAKKLITDVNTLSSTLATIKSDPDLAAALQGMQTLNATDLGNAQTLFKDVNTLVGTLNGIGTDNLNAMNTNIKTILDNSSNISGLLNSAIGLCNEIDTSKITTTDLANVGSLASDSSFGDNLQNNTLTPAEKAAIMSSLKINQALSPKALSDLNSLKTTLAQPQTQQLLGTLNTTLSNASVAENLLTQANNVQSDLYSNQKLLGIAGSVVKSKATPSLMQSAPQQVTDVMTDLNSNSQTLAATQQMLNSSSVQQIAGTLTPQAVGTMINDFTTSMPMLDGTKAILNAKSAQPLLGLAQNMNGMTTDLSNNVPLLQGVQQSLTVANINNVKPLLMLAPKFAQIKSDLASNTDNIALINDMVAKSSDPNVQALVPKVQELQKELDQAKPLITQLNTPEMMTNLSQSPAMVNQLVSMQKDLQNNAKILEVTKNELSDNNIATAQNLINSVPTLTDSVNKLYDGMTQLSDGSKELNTKLTDGATKINSNLVNSSETMGTFVSDPVSIKDNPMYSIKTYGEGFAPYFIPLSLWVGAIMMFFVITDKVDDDIKASPASLVLGKFISYGYIGIMQAVLASIAVLCLGLHPKNIVLYFVFNIFMSYVFIAIIQSLIFLLGQAGRLLSIVLLILQLTSCAGTFPLEVVPKFFKVLNPFMPFTYCSSALRELVGGPDYTIFFKDMGILAAVAVVFLMISVVMKGHADKLQEVIEERKAQAAAN